MKCKEWAVISKQRISKAYLAIVEGEPREKSIVSILTVLIPRLAYGWQVYGY
jgi:hypothetical protein